MTRPVVLALDFGGTKFAAAVGELDGVRLGTATVPAAAELGARPNLSRAVSAGRDLLDRVAPGRPVAGIGVSTFGIPGPDGSPLRSGNHRYPAASVALGRTRWLASRIADISPAVAAWLVP